MPQPSALSLEQLREFIELSPDAIIGIAADGSIVLSNRLADAMFGYPPADLLGRSMEILVPEAIRERHASHREGFTRMPATRAMGMCSDLSAQRSDGSLIPVEISLSPVWIESRLIVIAAIRDISERMRIQQTLQNQAQALARSNEALQRFAYIASHDLQEPLRMVSSYVQLLKRRYGSKLDKDADEFIGFAVDGVQRMQAMINDLLEYSRVGRDECVFEAVDCQKLLDQTRQNLSAVIAECGAVISHDRLPIVHGQPSELLRLFQNLISNALKFRGEMRPQVHISARRRDDGWLFSVRDNGIGIDPKQADKIFAIFKRLHAHHEYPGTGMGLAICRRIVEHHGGDIWVESAPGQGATFHFTIRDDDR